MVVNKISSSYFCLVTAVSIEAGKLATTLQSFVLENFVLLVTSSMYIKLFMWETWRIRNVVVCVGERFGGLDCEINQSSTSNQKRLESALRDDDVKYQRHEVISGKNAHFLEQESTSRDTARWVPLPLPLTSTLTPEIEFRRRVWVICTWSPDQPNGIQQVYWPRTTVDAEDVR